MNAGFVHNLNPVITHVGSVNLYYYGLAYAVGFGGSMIWFGSSAGVAVAGLMPEAKSAARWSPPRLRRTLPGPPA